MTSRRRIGLAPHSDFDDDRKHDRDSTGRLQQGSHSCTAGGQNDIRCKRDQFHRIFADALAITCSPAAIEPHIASVSPSRLLQSLQECFLTRASPTKSLTSSGMCTPIAFVTSVAVVCAKGFACQELLIGSYSCN